MDAVEAAPELLQFFKALANASRLEIAGRLARRPHSAEELAAALDERPGTVIRHLQYLMAAELVSGPEGPEHAYRLRLDRIHDLAARLLAHETVVVPEAAAANDFEHKVLSDFLAPDGMVKELPAQEKKFQVIVRYVLRAFKPGRRYSEKEVNALIKQYHPDSATLRRAMIDYRWLEREQAGQAYWLAGS